MNIVCKRIRLHLGLLYWNLWNTNVILVFFSEIQFQLGLIITTFNMNCFHEEYYKLDISLVFIKFLCMMKKSFFFIYTYTFLDYIDIEIWNLKFEKKIISFLCLHQRYSWIHWWFCDLLIVRWTLEGQAAQNINSRMA